MRYVTCPNCGKRLCKGEVGSKIEIECSKCGEPIVLEIQFSELIIESKSEMIKLAIRQIAK